MNREPKQTQDDGKAIDIIAFRLHQQEFCVQTTTIREIRGWAPCTPIPHAPHDVLGVMNLRGSVIPIIDLAGKLGMRATEANQRCAIVVAEVHGTPIGLVVDNVSDILTVQSEQIQPVPDLGGSFNGRYAQGIITRESGMICFLDLEQIFTAPLLMEEAA